MENLHERKKLTMGRRKIEIKKIQKKTSLHVTFTKRRAGLFKKACELSILTGSNIAILVESPANKIYPFGSPSVEAVLHRFDTGTGFTNNDYNANAVVEYEEAVRRLKKVKMENVSETVNRGMKGIGEFWWDQQIEGMEVEELEEYLESLEGLRKNVLCRIEEMEIMRTYSSSSCVFDVVSSVHASMEGTSGGLHVDQSNCNNEESHKLVEIDIGDDFAVDDAHMGKDDGAGGYSNLGTNHTYSFDFEDLLFTSNYQDCDLTCNDLELEGFLGGW